MAEPIRFDGRVALVTGGGGGLGREYCLELARRGAKIVVNDLGGSATGDGASQSPAQGVVDEIIAAGGLAVASYDSVASRAGGAAIVQTALDAFGRLDIVINNAGFLRNNRFEDLDDSEIDSVLEVHLKGAFYVSQPAYRAMKANGYGRFIFTGSASAMYGHAWQANYAAAKGGVMGLSHIVALEGARHGILSNLLMPTAHTRMNDVMTTGFLEVPSFAAAVQRIPFDEFNETLARAYNTPLVLYLASERCTASHNLYSQLGGRYARVFIGVVDGWLAPVGGPPTAEDIETNWKRIEDRALYHLPHSVYEEFEVVLEKRRREAAA